MLLKRFFFLMIISLYLFSCKTNPDVLDNTDPDITPDKPYVVSEDIYNQTFEEIEDLITELNSIISNRDFYSWKGYLSESYIDYYGSKEFLQEVSEKPYIRQYGIVLEDLSDYFREVVVLSRPNVSLEEITFDDENHITVWSLFNNQNVKLYQLEKINHSWKISIW